MSKISIIIPVYNAEKYLSKCLDSVINQTYKDLEIICVNDGSTDNSLQILEEYAKKDDRIKIINKQNGGLSCARNVGLDAVSSEYCYFLDSDDWIELNCIEELYNSIISNDVDVVIHDVRLVMADNSLTERYSAAQAWYDNCAKDDGIYTVPLEIINDICTVAWNKLYKMSIINKYNCRFPEGLINEDELFIWAYMIHCKKYYFLNKKLYYYLRHLDSITGTKNNSLKVLDILYIQEQIYETVKKHKNIADYQEYLTQNYINQVNRLFQIMPKKYRKKALKLIKQYYENINHDKRILQIYKQYKYKKLKQFLQSIFSIKNIKNDNYIEKQIKFLGIKFSFKA